jgi:hypothetical protein
LDEPSVRVIRVDLLSALTSVTGQMEDSVEVLTMHRAKQALEAFAPLYADLEAQVLAYSLAKAES